MLPELATLTYNLRMSPKQAITAAELLRDLRRGQGRSLRGAAMEIGIAPSHLSRLERGVRNVSPEIGHRIADYYGIDAELVTTNQNPIPSDVVEILLRHPELIDQLRATYRDQRAEDARHE